MATFINIQCANFLFSRRRLSCRFKSLSLTSHTLIIFRKFYRAVSSFPITALLSYSHTVLSRFDINGISESSSSRPIWHLCRAGPSVCMAINWFEFGFDCGAPLIVIVCDTLRTPAMVPPYDGQLLFGWRGNVHVFEGLWKTFDTGFIMPMFPMFIGDWLWCSEPLRSVQ